MQSYKDSSIKQLGTTAMRTIMNNISDIDAATIRFAGDSGDGMQLTGTQFSDNTAIFGNDLATLPDFPAEIRAPKGSLAGVSSFQLQFSNKDVHTPGDELDVLVAMQVEPEELPLIQQFTCQIPMNPKKHGKTNLDGSKCIIG